MKNFVTRKQMMSFKVTNNIQHSSVIASRLLVEKKEDPIAFTILSNIGSFNFYQTLNNFRASINMISLVLYKKLGLGAPKPTFMRLLMVDWTVKKPIGILCDILVRVASCIFLANFVILDYEVDFKVLIIIRRPFLATGRALVDIEMG